MRRADAVVVAGTDTGIGKTVFAAALTRALDGRYWKPVQAGADADTPRAHHLSGLPADRFLPEAYALRTPCSPHLAAQRDRVAIDEANLKLPAPGRPLIVELAGGLLVPLSPTLLQIDVVARWEAPVVLCARTALGTINHTLLSIEALRARRMSLVGVAFIGEPEPEVENSIVALGRTRKLGRLPLLPALDAMSLARAFDENFKGDCFSLGVAA